ncbi:50S ribosomal protein L35 [candidate division WOR-1 bacterium RIFOXYB2_FULL_42_35]|uniref:Large ribosomal subunit protein bL35 n=1 Tax=candidate division WOR-1 bacterium RIFOXYC2_FULL_41_25 TaxID=1802586 RepID=A0A1F4TRJ0_UNCSA|nr:MAG: 50S ribosomal protein L35 [candidate division WOR-1 bacterium RIFOXYA2_FULL_41_14]OGC25828.1 MAG: 50S ribosomal protein L35 [candidate division WOR-1 bacterium RIFOXYB2_FULL_42_35]OGC35268.1 MAG: 50S ribosomal protein L35 [candidate division WOR-1 bacterium RIFOXYC2_FULL_41_25]OGC43440.1 MAG: 50S ribosomal protein L35 [candidate division WOR-1 bacterium RIFOXYD2_FULL_41_8]
MPKQKTRRAAKKRFRITKKGKVLRGHTKMRHLLACKTPKQRGKLRQSGLVSASDVPRVKQMLVGG